jgi:hypothetical protein
MVQKFKVSERKSFKPFKIVQPLRGACPESDRRVQNVTSIKKGSSGSKSSTVPVANRFKNSKYGEERLAE